MGDYWELEWVDEDGAMIHSWLYVSKVLKGDERTQLKEILTANGK